MNGYKLNLTCQQANDSSEYGFKLETKILNILEHDMNFEPNLKMWLYPLGQINHAKNNKLGTFFDKLKFDLSITDSEIWQQYNTIINCENYNDFLSSRILKLVSL